MGSLLEPRRCTTEEAYKREMERLTELRQVKAVLCSSEVCPRCWRQGVMDEFEKENQKGEEGGIEAASSDS